MQVIYQAINHDIYHMVYTIWYISLDLWYLPVESGIYRDATFQMRLTDFFKIYQLPGFRKAEFQVGR